MYRHISKSANKKASASTCGRYRWPRGVWCVGTAGKKLVYCMHGRWCKNATVRFSLSFMFSTWQERWKKPPLSLSLSLSPTLCLSFVYLFSLVFLSDSFICFLVLLQLIVDASCTKYDLRPSQSKSSAIKRWLYELEIIKFFTCLIWLQTSVNENPLNW